jgi:hypothetical protein
MPDSEIDVSDIPEMTEAQLARKAPLRDYLEARRKKSGSQCGSTKTCWSGWVGGRSVTDASQ